MLIVAVPNVQNVKIWEVANQIATVSVICAKIIPVFVSDSFAKFGLLNIFLFEDLKHAPIE